MSEASNAGAGRTDGGAWRAVVWAGEPEWQGGWRAEMSGVELGGDGLRAAGTQLGRDPLPYRLHYVLDATGEGCATRSLRAVAGGAGWERRLGLERSADGEWTIESGADGAPELAAPGGEAAALAGVLDCDLGFSPLTNAMPIRRHGLHRGSGRVDLVVAWVSVPDLSVEALAQRYTHLRRTGDGAIVRYESIADGEVVFSSDLQIDLDGLIRVYPKLARRIGQRSRWDRRGSRRRHRSPAD